MNEDTNNQLLHDIAGVDRKVYLTNNQLLKIIAEAAIGGGGDADTLDGEPGSYYLNRANQTGTQAVSTITGLQTLLDAKVAKAGDTMTGVLTLPNLGLRVQDTAPNGALILSTDQSWGGDRVLYFRPNANGRVLAINGNTTLNGGVFSGVNTGDQIAATVPNTPSGNITSTNVQDALNELDADITALPGALHYVTSWDAATNTPTLADGVGNNGDFYKASSAGNPDLGSGPLNVNIGDHIVYDGSTYQNFGASEAVSSVNGKVGVVVLNPADVGAVNKTGDTMTGLLTLPNITLQGASVQAQIDPGGTTLDLGTTSAHNVNLATNNITRMSLAASGDVQMAAGYTPANPRSIVTKEYADTKANDADVVKLTGDQSVAGVKTFSDRAVFSRVSVDDDSSVGIASTNPQFTLFKTDGPSDAKRTNFLQDDTGLTIRTFFDGVELARNILSAQRNGGEVAAMTFGDELSSTTYQFRGGGFIRGGTGYAPSDALDLTTKEYVDTKAHGGDGADVYVLPSDQEFLTESPIGVSAFSQIVLADDKTEVRLLECELYISGPHEDGINFRFNNINEGTITYNGSALIPSNDAPQAIYTDYAKAAGLDVDTDDTPIQKVTLSLYVTSTPTGGSYGGLLFGAKKQANNTPASPVVIHAGSKITSRLISST